MPPEDKQTPPNPAANAQPVDSAPVQSPDQTGVNPLFTSTPLRSASTPPPAPGQNTGPSPVVATQPGPGAPLTTTQNATRPHLVPSPTGKKKKVVSTQSTLEISEIRDGLVIMRDGSLRSVVMCQSINFDLMSPAEREAVESSYQGFLNSLYFPIQIFIRSRRVDLDSYIDKLQKVHDNQESILLSLLMEDYIAYVRYLIENSNIMDKQFYIVVPYFPTLTDKAGAKIGLGKLGAMFKPGKQQVVINESDFNEYKTELTQRVQVVLNSLSQMNVQAIPLNTQELIELYYTVYNPQTANNEKLGNVNDLEAPIISKGAGEAKRVLPGETE